MYFSAFLETNEGAQIALATPSRVSRPCVSGLAAVPSAHEGACHCITMSLGVASDAVFEGKVMQGQDSHENDH